MEEKHWWDITHVVKPRKGSNHGVFIFMLQQNNREGDLCDILMTSLIPLIFSDLILWELFFQFIRELQMTFGYFEEVRSERW